MDRKVKSFRLRVDLLDWLESYAQTRGSSQIAVLEAAVESFQGLSEGGVPNLPVVERVQPVPGVVRARTLVPPSVESMSRQRKLNESAARARSKS
jgi:hypothetical protein